MRGLKPTQYRQLYYAISTSMVVVVGVAVVMFALQAATDANPPSAWLFVVEALLLFLFIAFWLAQTAENWKLGSAVVDDQGPSADAPDALTESEPGRTAPS